MTPVNSFIPSIKDKNMSSEFNRKCTYISDFGKRMYGIQNIKTIIEASSFLKYFITLFLLSF